MEYIIKGLVVVQHGTFTGDQCQRQDQGQGPLKPYFANAQIRRIDIILVFFLQGLKQDQGHGRVWPPSCPHPPPHPHHSPLQYTRHTRSLEHCIIIIIIIILTPVQFTIPSLPIRPLIAPGDYIRLRSVIILLIVKECWT